jgi:hypothetical protein
MTSYPEPKFPSVIDNTMRGSFVDCPQQFYQEFILKRALKGGSVHLIAGGAYAKGLEIVRSLVWGEGYSLEDALVEAYPAIVAEYGDFPCPEHQQYKSCERVIQGVIAYFDKYNPHTDHMQPYMKKNGKPAVEFTFSFPTQLKHPDTGEPILYAGRFDMIGTYNGLNWVVDDKTASQLGAAWDKSWRLKAQMTGYVFAARQFGIPVEGAIIRGTSFLRTGAYGFSEPMEYRAAWQVERWWVQLHRDIGRMIQCWQDKDDDHPFGYWDYNLHNACSSFGGCGFQQLCSVHNPEEWAKTDYERREWNPLDINPAGIKGVEPTIMSS